MLRVREFFENCVCARHATHRATISLHVHTEFLAETFAVINIARVRMHRVVHRFNIGGLSERKSARLASIFRRAAKSAGRVAAVKNGSGQTVAKRGSKEGATGKREYRTREAVKGVAG